MSTATIAPLFHRHLPDAQVWDRLVADLMAKDGLDEQDATEALDQCLAFLTLPAGYAPSPLVDTAWHRFILHTTAYRRHCLESVGRFVDHQPNDGTRSGPAPLGVDGLRERGMPVIERVWETSAKCANECSTIWDDK